MKKTESPERSRRILIIEDDVSLLQAYREMFKTQDVSVVGAASGQEGLTLVASEKPDLILLDIMLPGGMNGFDVLERLKEDPATQSIPVIVLTNLDSEAKVAKAIGAKDYLVKANTTKDEIVKIVMESSSIFFQR
jgi:CheY-like chemotaxis protein